MILNIKIAFTNLTATLLRTMLAMLGILVGTASVVAMVSSGQMATQQALAQFKTLGTDLMAISLYSEGATNSSSTQQIFDLNKVLTMQSTVPAIDAVAPYIPLYIPIFYHGHTINGSVIAATAALAKVIHINILAGRFVSDLDHYETYCVIGNKIYKNMQATVKNPIGSQIHLGNTIFTIIGVADNWPENSFFYQDINNSIIVPIHVSSLLGKDKDIQNIVLRLAPNADIAKMQESIINYINSLAPDKKLFFRSARELIKSATAQRKIFTLLLGFIGSISLLVGGIGVMNIMLVSVLERRREIGIRLALGARRSEIQSMFLMEAVLLSLIGGILGIMAGILSSFIIAKFAHWDFAVFASPILIGFIVSALIGIFFGFYPAYQASKLDPIQTLRSE